MQTYTPNASATLRLGYKVQKDWEAYPDLFAVARMEKSSYDAALARAEAASAKVRAAREQRRAEAARLKSIRAEAMAKAKADYDRGMDLLREGVATAAAEEKQALTELSRLANGARYFAKGSALSDASLENDAAARTF